MSHQGYGRRALEAWLRGGGSGEAVFAPDPSTSEVKGSGETELAPEPRYSQVLALSLFLRFLFP